MEPEEFEVLFRAVYPQLVRFAGRHFDADTADDLATMALQSIWEKNVPAPADEEGERRLRSLAFRVIEGYMRNAARDATSYRRAIGTYVAREGRPTEQADVADSLADREWPHWVRDLSPSDRKVLALVVDGYKVAEIAVILGCKPSAVTTRLQRAKRRAQALAESRTEVDRVEE